MADEAVFAFRPFDDGDEEEQQDEEDDEERAANEEFIGDFARARKLPTEAIAGPKRKLVERVSVSETFGKFRKQSALLPRNP